MCIVSGSHCGVELWWSRTGQGSSELTVEEQADDDDDDLLFVLAETTNSLLIYTRLGTPSRDR
jgi:hypothetical protein